jgi:hypothetical protein
VAFIYFFSFIMLCGRWWALARESRSFFNCRVDLIGR